VLLADFIRSGSARLESLYPSPEARGLVLMLCEEKLGVASYTHIIEPQTVLPPEREQELAGDLDRLCHGEPIQYVLGVAEFCGHRFAVGPGVLIPRPETELLVAEAVRTLREMELDRPPRVLDLCTGSGCIAWSIAKEIRDAEIVGLDLSETALRYARSQFYGGISPDPPAASSPFPTLLTQSPGAGRSADADIASLHQHPTHPSPAGTSSSSAGTSSSSADGKESSFADLIGDPSEARDGDRQGGKSPAFLQADVLDTEQTFGGGPFDLIVSNPPYVLERERAQMRSNVLEHEPALALFVPDDDPLRFYRAIARWAQRFLRPGGVGLVEINETLGPETAAVLRDAGFKNIQIHRDFAQKDRFIRFSVS